MGHAAVRLLALLALALLGAPASGDPLARAEAAYHRGNYALAIELWQPLADAGNARAQFALGTVYFYGHGVEADPATATRWYRAAAEQGYGPAQFNLGNAYKHGRGVAADEAEAAEWWRRAAEQDYAVAQFNLALQYYHGLGVPEDGGQALYWFRRAAANGHERARAIVASLDEQQAPPAAPAPAPAPAPAAPPQARSDREPVRVDDESWVLAQDPDAFTVQLLATADASRIAPSLARHGYTGRVATFRFERDGQVLFGVVHGAFPDRASARTAVAALPERMRKRRPWIRRIADVQALIRSAPGR